MKVRNRVCLLTEALGDANCFRAAVSLHCHTQHSKEVLDFIPHYASRIPVVKERFHRGLVRYREVHGRGLEFSRAYWTPPLSARQVFDLEVEQIRKRLGLEGMVSLTDHDDIESGTLLQAIEPLRQIPISVEWTVPFGTGFFHLGVHNLPIEQSAQIMRDLADCTAKRGTQSLAELLAMLDELPGVLTVLNHPFWDIERIGHDAHLASLKQFLAQYGQWLHAIEINGYRSWDENNSALQLAESLGCPVISGGDRHGCSVNATLNLTSATGFAEFVAEVRQDKQSTVLLMPEYRDNLPLRMLESAADVLRFYPQHPRGRQHWTERVFVSVESEEVRPLSAYWKNGGPAWVRLPVWTMRLLGSRRFRLAMRLVWTRREEVSI